MTVKLINLEGMFNDPNIEISGEAVKNLLRVAEENNSEWDLDDDDNWLDDMLQAFWDSSTPIQRSAWEDYVNGMPDEDRLMLNVKWVYTDTISILLTVPINYIEPINLV